MKRTNWVTDFQEVTPKASSEIHERSAVNRIVFVYENTDGTADAQTLRKTVLRRRFCFGLLPRFVRARQFVRLWRKDNHT